MRGANCNDKETNMAEDTIEIPATLETVLRGSLNDARKRMEAGEEIVPFTALYEDGVLHMREHPGETVEECFASAKETVAEARSAIAYSFCYDGFVDTDSGKRDALIAEGGLPGEPYGCAIGLIYKLEEAGPKFWEQPIYVGPASNYMCMFGFDDEDEPEAEAAGDEAPEAGDEA